MSLGRKPVSGYKATVKAKTQRDDPYGVFQPTIVQFVHAPSPASPHAPGDGRGLQAEIPLAIFEAKYGRVSPLPKMKDNRAVARSTFISPSPKPLVMATITRPHKDENTSGNLNRAMPYQIHKAAATARSNQGPRSDPDENRPWTCGPSARTTYAQSLRTETNPRPSTTGNDVHPPLGFVGFHLSRKHPGLNPTGLRLDKALGLELPESDPMVALQHAANALPRPLSNEATVNGVALGMTVRPTTRGQLLSPRNGAGAEEAAVSAFTGSSYYDEDARPSPADMPAAAAKAAMAAFAFSKTEVSFLGVDLGAETKIVYDRSLAKALNLPARSFSGRVVGLKDGAREVMATENISVEPPLPHHNMSTQFDCGLEETALDTAAASVPGKSGDTTTNAALASSSTTTRPLLSPLSSSVVLPEAQTVNGGLSTLSVSLRKEIAAFATSLANGRGDRQRWAAQLLAHIRRLDDHGHQGIATQQQGLSQTLEGAFTSALAHLVQACEECSSLRKQSLEATGQAEKQHALIHSYEAKFKEEQRNRDDFANIITAKVAELERQNDAVSKMARTNATLVEKVVMLADEVRILRGPNKNRGDKLTRKEKEAIKRRENIIADRAMKEEEKKTRLLEKEERQRAERTEKRNTRFAVRALRQESKEKARREKQALMQQGVIDEDEANRSKEKGKEGKNEDEEGDEEKTDLTEDSDDPSDDVTVEGLIRTETASLIEGEEDTEDDIDRYMGNSSGTRQHGTGGIDAEGTTDTDADSAKGITSQSADCALHIKGLEDVEALIYLTEKRRLAREAKAVQRHARMHGDLEVELYHLKKDKDAAVKRVSVVEEENEQFREELQRLRYANGAQWDDWADKKRFMDERIRETKRLQHRLDIELKMREKGEAEAKRVQDGLWKQVMSLQKTILSLDRLRKEAEEAKVVRASLEINLEKVTREKEHRAAKWAAAEERCKEKDAIIHGLYRQIATAKEHVSAVEHSLCFANASMKNKEQEKEKLIHEITLLKADMNVLREEMNYFKEWVPKELMTFADYKGELSKPSAARRRPDFKVNVVKDPAANKSTSEADAAEMMRLTLALMDMKEEIAQLEEYRCKVIRLERSLEQKQMEHVKDVAELTYLRREHAELLEKIKVMARTHEAEMINAKTQIKETSKPAVVSASVIKGKSEDTPPVHSASASTPDDEEGNGDINLVHSKGVLIPLKHALKGEPVATRLPS